MYMYAACVYMYMYMNAGDVLFELDGLELKRVFEVLVLGQHGDLVAVDAHDLALQVLQLALRHHHHVARHERMRRLAALRRRRRHCTRAQGQGQTAGVQVTVLGDLTLNIWLHVGYNNQH